MLSINIRRILFETSNLSAKEEIRSYESKTIIKGVNPSPDSDDHFDTALAALLVLSDLDQTTNAFIQLDLSLVLATPSS